MSEFDEFAADVRRGLARTDQKQLPSKYLYDALGSALFETICLLPEYGVTRAGFRLLERYRGRLAEHLPRQVLVAELGSGTGRKTRLLLEELGGRAPVAYYPIDVSAPALRTCVAEMGDIPNIQITSIEGTYHKGLERIADERTNGQNLFVLFLGGTIGNFMREPAASFLRDVRQTLRNGDHLLLAADLEKSLDQLIPAYDDPLGVTAAFNLNVLARINRELGGDFDLDQFEHVARWNEKERAVEMHLRSRIDQTATVSSARLRVDLRAGETIWTESSYRYSPDELVRLGERTGFGCVEQWVDEEWPFAQTLFRAR